VASVISIEHVPLGDRRLRAFFDLPYRLRGGTTPWVPPLRAELFGSWLLGMRGLLTPSHPIHRELRSEHLLARRGKTVVGTLSVATLPRFDAFHRGRYAFFGFFACENDVAIAHPLFDAAASWARAQGASILRGPGEYTNATHDRQGLLIDGFDTDSYIEQTWNEPYQAVLVSSYGFRKAMDYHAYEVDFTRPLPAKLARIAAAVATRRDLHTRPLERRHLARDIQLIVELYNRAWAENWGHLPITGWEADSLVHALKSILDPGLVRFAYRGVEPVAVLGAFPDPNALLALRGSRWADHDALRLLRVLWGRRHITRIRTMFFGVLPGHRGAGADALLYSEVHAYAVAHGYTRSDMSLMLESNTPMIRVIEAMGGERSKTWRIYDLPLMDCPPSSEEVAAHESPGAERHHDDQQGEQS
jgi:GNAT superfamily N-acetyltransferase